MRCIGAIDPGKEGGIAFLSVDEVEASKLPSDLDVLGAKLTYSPVDRLYLEDVGFQVFPGRPPKAMGMLQRNMGQVEGICSELGIEVVLVPPRIWQQSCRAGNKSNHADERAWKNHLKSIAQKLYPDLKVTLATADALLILNYATKQQ